MTDDKKYIGKIITGMFCHKNVHFLQNLAGPFRRFPTSVWQNARVNIVRRAMVCHVYFPFPKILELY